MLAVTIIEYCFNKNDNNKDLSQYNPVETVTTPLSKPRYEVKKFVLEDYAGEPNICGICLLPINGGNIAVLKCLHFFHPDCLEKWTKIRSICPTCKIPIE